MDNLKDFTLDQLAKDFVPYPKLNDRKSWEALDSNVKEFWIDGANKYKDMGIPQLTATMYMEFSQNGNRTRLSEPYFMRRSMCIYMCIAECIENKGRYLEPLLNLIWAICEESTWAVSAHNLDFTTVDNKPIPLPEPGNANLALFSAETGTLLSFIYYFLKDRFDDITPIICDRIKYELDIRVITPFLERYNYEWMGLVNDKEINNWCPWVTSNALFCILIAEDNPKKKLAGIRRALFFAQSFIDVYHLDGGCDEGTSYWGHASGALFDLLNYLYKATDGKYNAFEDAKIQNMGKFLYRAQISEKYFINFADGSAKPDVSSNTVFNYGKIIGDEYLMALGAGYAKDTFKGIKKDEMPPVERWSNRSLEITFTYKEMMQQEVKHAYLKHFYFRGIQVMSARETEGTTDGFFVGAKGGHNDESHNHNDVGTVIVALNGEPVLLDIGVGTYERKTFSPRRYEIFSMQSSYHNLPDINGYMQLDGRDYRAKNVTCTNEDNQSKIEMDISSAYPNEAGVKSYIRTVTLNRETSIVTIEDDYELEKAESLSYNFMTMNKPEIAAGDVKITTNKNDCAILSANDTPLSYSIESCDTTDPRLQVVWGDNVYRVVGKLDNVCKQGNVKFTLKQ